MGTTMTAEAAACRDRIRSLFQQDLPKDAGVIQAASIWLGPDGTSRVIALGESAPVSPTDTFVLNLTRSRADAIVTTGSILRAEPRVTHNLLGSERDRAELNSWRREFLDRTQAPLSVVLTRDPNLDLNQPLFHAGNPCAIYTQTETAKTLQAAAAEHEIEVVGEDSPSLRNALAWLRTRHHARTISVEAGPSAACTLYQAPIAVCEMFLSVYEEPHLPKSAQGPAFFSAQELTAKGFQSPGPVTRQEPSGCWSFRRLVRRDA